MTTKSKIKAASKQSEAWEKRRGWEAAWRKSVAGKMFKPETVMMGKTTVSGKPSTILASKGFKK